MTRHHKYTSEHDEFIVAHSPNNTAEELKDKFNEAFGCFVSAIAISHRKRVLNVPKDFSKRFKAGHVAWNKGLKGYNAGNPLIKRFEKGHSVWCSYPLYSEKIDPQGFVTIKIAHPKKWRRKHLWVYEQAFGTIPKHHSVIFLDGDTRNFDIKNLFLVGNLELLVLCRMQLYSSPTNKNRQTIPKKMSVELATAAVSLAKLIIQLRKVSGLGMRDLFGSC